MPKALCIMSGGMDSTLVAYLMRARGYEIIAVHFDYHQRTMHREKEAFDAVCEALEVRERYAIGIDFFATIGASALTNPTLAVPTQGVEEGIPITYVPFRNGIFLSIAGAIAEKEGCDVIAIGVVEEDSSGYPDCREHFIETFERALNLGTRDTTSLRIEMPLVHLSKADIVRTALEHHVPLELTWSCYQSCERACGVCDSCRLRLRGFERAGVCDPIAYA